MVNRQFHSVSDYLFDRFALRYVEFIKKSQNQPLVGEAGFEPARPKPHAPKACASTIPPLPRLLNGTFRRLLDGSHALALTLTSKHDACFASITTTAGGRRFRCSELLSCWVAIRGAGWIALWSRTVAWTATRRLSSPFRQPLADLSGRGRCGWGRWGRTPGWVASRDVCGDGGFPFSNLSCKKVLRPLPTRCC